MNKYLEGWGGGGGGGRGAKLGVNMFSKSIINRWSVGFTKPMIDYEILADSQH